MATVDPSKHRILLVGPRVIHLKPFFERRRYNVTAVQKGVEGMSALDAEPRDIVILELNLGDLTATEFLMAARQAHADASFLLLDDASKAGQIVKALQAGLDGYLPTPPDEDRLFFEVERHLRHAGGGGDGNGFQGATQVSKSPAAAGKEVTDLQTQLADRESQLVEIGMQNDLLQQEIIKLREEAKKLNAVRGALIGQLDGDLDEAQAMKLKERLAMATVLETESDTLREELAGARNVRRELQEQIDGLKRKVSELSQVEAVESVEDVALREKNQELEADNMVLAGRVAELEEELDLTKAEVVALEQKQKSEMADLQRELNRLSSDQALREADDDKAALQHSAALSKLENEHKQTVAKLESEHKNALARLKEEHEGALKRAVSDVEIERAQVQSKIQEAVQNALSGKEKELHAKLQEALAEKERIEGERDQAIGDKEAAVGKALDIELTLDELKIRIEHLEGEVTKERERANKIDEGFKKDKLRLIQEKEQAASGSQDAFEKVQRFINENTTLKRQNQELESTRAALEERAKRGEELAKKAEIELAEIAVVKNDLTTARDAAESARKTAEEKLQAIERNLTERIARLEAQAEEANMRREAAERALGEAGQAANKLADANAARIAAEREAERLSALLGESEPTIVQLRADLDAVRSQASSGDAAAGDLRGRIGALEDKILEKDAAAREAREAATAAQQELARRERELVDQYEAKLREALSGGGKVSTEVLAERDAYRTRLAETEAWVQQAQLHLEALRVERDQLAAQATALANDLQARSSESQELYGQLSAQKQQVQELTGRAAALDQELLVARQQASRAAQAASDAQQQAVAAQAAAQAAAAAGGGGGGSPALNEELRVVRGQLQQAQGQVQQAQQALQQAGQQQQMLAQAQQAIAQLQQQLQQAQQRGGGGGGDGAMAVLQDEVKTLRVQLQQAQSQVQRAASGAPRLPEELEPLRWTLTAAIDALTALETREPALASHLRNLRLLASTLQKLSPNG